MLVSSMAVNSFAQTNIANYTLSQSTSTYTPITGGTVFIAANTPFDQEISAAITIPSFNFGGTAITSMYIAANGYITFGGTPAATNYTPLSTTGTGITGVISGLAADLGYGTGNGTTGATSEIRHELVGTEYVVQYTDVKRWNSTNERISFQIRLNTANGQIKIVYGGPIVIGSSTSSLQIGLRGNSTAYASNVNSLMIGNVPASTTCDWNNAVTAYDNSSTLYMNTTNAAVTPVAGLTYTWTPGTQAPVRTFSAVSNILPTSATINYTAPTGATQYNVRYRVPGTCTWTNASGNPYTGTAATITGLTANTTYQVQVKALNGATESIWSHIPNQAGSGNGYIAAGTFTTLPSCVVPTALTYNTVTNNGATVKWNKPVVIPANGYEYYVSTTNTAPTSTTTPTGTATDSFKVITGLPAATLHYVWVRSNCSTSDKSTWTSSTSFTTLCATPAPGATIASSSTNLCAGAVVNFSLTTVPTGPGLSYLWQSSLDGVNYVNITTATASTFSASVSAIYYRCRVVCTGGPDTVYSTPVQLSYTNSVATTTGAQRCGAGSVTLNATGNTGSTINWYDVASGGTSLGTGASFVTPVVANTTPFYAEASQISSGTATVGAGASAGNSVAYNPLQGGYGGLKGQYIFTAAELLNAGLSAGNINSIALDITTAGATLNGFTVAMGNTALSTFPDNNIQAVAAIVAPSAAFVPTVGINTITFTTPFVWDGVSNVIVSISWSNNNSSNTSSSLRFDATSSQMSLTYRKDNETAANMLAFTGATGSGTSTFDRTSNRPKVIFGGQVVCKSARKEAVATINTAPTFTITNDKTVCNNATTPLTVTSTQASYNNVTWSPVAGLFTDAAATVPYVANTHAYTVYHKSNVIGSESYIATAQNTTTLCGGIDTVKIQVIPPAITAIASPGTLCLTGSSVVKISPVIPQTGELYQWQSSTDNVNFTNVGSVVTADTLATGTLTATRYFRAIVKNSDSVTCFNSVSDTVLVNTPSITGTTPATRCGIGPVTLQATGSTGTTLNWYTVATGGTPVSTGGSYTTPTLTNTTTYYVEAVTGGTVNVGPLSPTAQGGTIGTQTTGWDINFVVTQATTLKSIDIFPVTSGETGVIRIQTGTGFSGTILQTINYTTNVGGGTTPQTITFDYPLSPGTYSLYTSTLPASGIRRNTSGAVYPYTSTVANITANGYDQTYYMGAYNWVFGSGCVSNRTPVVATVTPAPAFDITNDKTVCNNSVTALTAITGGSNYNNVTWTPAANLYTNAAATTAYVAGTHAATVYYKNATPGITTITANANNTTSNCANLDTIKIQTLPAAINVVVAPKQLCESGVATISYTPAISQTGFTQQWSGSADNIGFADINGATSSSYTTPTLTNTRYYRITVKNSDGATCLTSTDTVKVLHPQITQTVAAERCGPGILTLNATAIDGIAKWYAAANGGTPLATGNSFTTPNITNTTTYYVGAGSGKNDTVTVGSGTTTSSGFPNPFNKAWGGSRHQYLITAQELTTAGLTAGPIQGVALDIVAISTSGTAAQRTMNDLTIKLGSTTNTTMAGGFVPTTGLQTVYNNAAGYLPTATGWNYLNFANSYNWDGVSNLIVEFTHNSGNTGGGGAHTIRMSTTTYPATFTRWADNVTPATAAEFMVTTTTSGSTNSYSTRANMRFYANTLCEGPRTAVIATIKPKPVAGLTPNGNINLCDGETQTLTASGTGTYTWLRNNAIVSGQTGSTLAVTQANPYKVVVTGANGCTDTSVTANITIVPKPVVHLGNDTAVCANETLQLNAGNQGATYLWSNNTTAQTIDVTTPGQYSVTVTNNFNCIARDTINVTHLAIPVVDLGADTAICPSRPLTLDAQNPGAAYLWNNGNTGQTLIVDQVGTYAVAVTNADQCTGTDTINVSFVPAIANLGFDFEPLFNIQPGRVKFTPIDINPDYTYTWNFGDGNTSTQTIAQHDYTVSGDYVVTLNVSDGCADSLETLEIRVDLFTSSVSRVKQSDLSVKIYPNPTSSVLNVVLETENTHINKLSIFNLLGQNVTTIVPATKNTKQQEIQLSNLASGAYLIKIETDKGTVNRKFEYIK
ncbi:MAG: hypothetical protein BGO31_03935 [Bacteroidetes bacterium 43-16]|nr:MAG: hypothetical protein BGO31_03935 [Bacteroidetes bacterium 43-16]